MAFLLNFINSSGTICQFFLYKALTKSLSEGELSTSQSRAIIRLIYKKGDRHLLKNWRPISLLNCDYKIFTTVLSKRLQSVLPKIINTDQTAYIKGRNIGENIRLINDIIEYSLKNNSSGSIIFLDFEKAFDTLEWNFMIATLEKFNFGKTFISYIKCIYNQCFSSITNNGRNSKFFKLTRGIRQGCSLSALLFVIAVEIMALNIRHNKNIKGFSLPDCKIPSKWSKCDTETKITQVADDTTIITLDQDSTFEVFKTVCKFSDVSGLKLNLSKTEGIWLNQNSIPTNLVKIKWSVGPVKSLGVYFGLDTEKVQKLNWDNKLDKLQRLLSVWRKRDLTLYGKSVVINVIAMSQIFYIMSVTDTPNDIIKTLEAIIYSFLWSGKRDKVKRTCIISDYAKGGIKLFDIKSKLNTLSASWIKRIVNPDFARWKIIPTTYLDHFGRNLLIIKMNFNSENIFPFMHDQYIPTFYKQMVINWHKSNVISHTPMSLIDIKNEIIWGNRHILCNNNCALFMKKWIDAGVIYIGDICNNIGFIATSTFKTKIKSASYIHEYKLILESIPKDWKICIRQNIENNFRQKQEDLFVWNNEIYTYQSIYKITSKTIYNYLLDEKATRAQSELYWELSFDRVLNWQEIWLNQTKHLTNNMKLVEFNFKLLHNILPSGKFLHRWKIQNSDLCVLCDIIDDYKHMFLHCKHIGNLWTIIIAEMCILFDIAIDVNYEAIILGYKSSENKKTTKLINIIFTLGKYTIFKSWCKNRKNKDKFSKIKLYHNFKNDLKIYISNEHYSGSDMYNLLNQCYSRL